MKDLIAETKKIIDENKKQSVFENILRLKSLFEAAEDEAADDTEEATDEGQEADPTTGGEEEGMTDPTEPAQDTEGGEPADESEGIYVSPNEKAVLAKTMLDALQATPPETGTIPADLLKVTDANADKVISYIQSIISLTNSLDTSETSDSNPDSLVSTLKQSN